MHLLRAGILLFVGLLPQIAFADPYTGGSQFVEVDGANITSLTTTLIVPPTPAKVGTTFLWPGLQSNTGNTNFLPVDNGVLQPVLTYGSSGVPNGPPGFSSWWISGAYVNTTKTSPLAQCNGGPSMNVQPGDKLLISIAADANGNWTQTITDQTSPNTPSVSYSINLMNQEQSRTLFITELYNGATLPNGNFMNTTVTFSTPTTTCKLVNAGPNDIVSTGTLSADKLSCSYDHVVLNATEAIINQDLQVCSDGDLGKTNNPMTFDGGTITLCNNVTTPRAFTVTANNATVDTNSYIGELDGTIVGAGSLTKDGSGTLVLTGNNTYSGGTYVNGGTLSISSDANLGASTGLLSLNGAALEVTGTTSFATQRSIALASGGGTFQIDNLGTDLQVMQGISGIGGLTKTGAGGLTLSGDNTYAGRTDLEAGTLSLTGAGSIAASSSLTVNNGTFSIGGIDASGTSVNNLSGAGGTVSIGGKTLTVNETNDGAFAGNFSGTGTLTKAGSAALALSSANAGFSGDVDLENGALSLLGAGSLASA